MSRRGLLVEWGGVLTTSPFESFATFVAAEGLPEYAMRAAFARGGPLQDLFVRARDRRGL
jgi:hypothetical protein